MSDDDLTNDDLKSTEGDEGDQQQQEPSFVDRARDAGRGAAFMGDQDAARFWNSIADPAELLEDGAAERIAKLKEASQSGRSLGAAGQELADAFTAIADNERATAEEAERQRLAADDEAMRERIRKERAEARAQAEREALEAERRVRLETEIEAEERAAGLSTLSSEDEHLSVIGEAAEAARAWKAGRLSTEEAHKAAQRGIAAEAALEGQDAEHPVSIDIDAFYRDLEEGSE